LRRDRGGQEQAAGQAARTRGEGRPRRYGSDSSSDRRRSRGVVRPLSRR
jgi:hypothetical protein